MPDLHLVSESPEETQRIARLLGEQCTGGEILFLVGPLGSGKTCFTQGLAWGLDVQEYTHSPTFVMVTEHHGRLTLYHVDLYRVESVEEAMELGIEEYLGAGGGVCAVEWADRILQALGRQGLLVELAYAGGQRRNLTLRPQDQRHEGLVGKLDNVMRRLSVPDRQGS